LFTNTALAERTRWRRSYRKSKQSKADLLYAEIDRNKLFKSTVPNPEDRSRMNVCFVMTEGNEGLEKEFGAFAKAKGMIGLEGHRSVGGFRASLYNALPIETTRRWSM
jgi:phosphoserine aminotransferase